MRLKKFGAFTLVELLVVVSVILVLSTFVALNLIGAKTKARDEKRINDANIISSALDQYALDNNRLYPTPGMSPTPPGTTPAFTFVSTSDAGFKAKLSPYLNPVPTDTLNGNDNLLYLFRSDGQKAAVLFLKFETGTKMCNTTGVTWSLLPEVLRGYLTGPPVRTEKCYYVAK